VVDARVRDMKISAHRHIFMRIHQLPFLVVKSAPCSFGMAGPCPTRRMYREKAGVCERRDRAQARTASMSMPHEANTRRRSGGSVSKCRVCSAKQTALPAIWLGLNARYANSWMVISARYSLKCRHCVCVCMSELLIFAPRKERQRQRGREFPCAKAAGRHMHRYIIDPCTGTYAHTWIHARKQQALAIA